MKIKLFVVIATVLLSATACGNKDRNKSVSMSGHTNDELKMTGDKTVYGLACEGCNDSTILLLPNDGSDPIKYDVIDAHNKGRVLGEIHVGDWIGVVLNKHDKHVADEVVNLDELKGIWCYVVMPKMRDYEKMSKKLQKRMMKDMPDSVKQTYLVPREYGFWLKRQWTAQSVGYVSEQSSLEDESPVIYPQLGYFTSWHIWNGKLVVVSATPVFNKDNTISTINPKNDTCSIDYLGEDSLVLSDRDGARSYYRKKDIKDVNVKAKRIAAQLKKDALNRAKEQE
jgi:hypothetical protein